MTTTKQLSLFIDEEDLKVIDEAANKTRRSRSNFIILASVEKAEQTLMDEEWKKHKYT